jgi:hypothetical protein
MRTQDEIVARIEAVKGDDFLGFRQQVLVDFLDFDHARPYLKPGTTPEVWAEASTQDATDDLIAEQAKGYMEFAWGKAENHRGLSAGRSIEKMTEYAWLLGRDDVLDAMDEAGYVNYGAPKLAAMCTLMGWPIPDDEGLQRMIKGQPCEPGCAMGCDV